jgi:hypothetical protein
MTSPQQFLASSTIRHRCVLYAVWLAVSGILFWRPLRDVIAYAAHNDSASYLLLIPFISVGVI